MSCNTHLAETLRSRCTVISKVCFEAEQVILHGPQGPQRMNELLSLLNRSRDTLDGLSLLHPWVRPTVRLAAEGSYRYLPLAFVASQAQRMKRRDGLLMHHTPSTSPQFSGAEALAFVSSWGDSFSETFARVVLRLHELSCGRGSNSSYLLPLMWPPALNYYLEPFGKVRTTHTADGAYQRPDTSSHSFARLARSRCLCRRLPPAQSLELVISGRRSISLGERMSRRTAEPPPTCRRRAWRTGRHASSERCGAQAI